MMQTLADRLKLIHRPVGIWFENVAVEAADINDDNAPRCIVSCLLAASNGKTVCLSEAGCKCPGGATGLGFGNAFVRRDASTAYLLSHGDDSYGLPDQAKLPPTMRKGERFFDCPSTVLRWIDELDLVDAEHTHVVFSALDDAFPYPIERNPDLVFVLANPDQLSALVIMTGYRNGRALNVIAPFCAGCQSILLAKRQLCVAEPLTIMGMFDLSQRGRIEPDLLSLTMTFEVYANIERDSDEGCLTSSAWKNLELRL